jgi:3'-5' exonuclease
MPAATRALVRRQLSEAGGLGLLDEIEREAMLDEISRLPQDIYENARKVITKALNWRSGTLDSDRKQRRTKRSRSGEDDPVTKPCRIEPWPDPVLDLGGVLDDAVAQLKRFLIVPGPIYLDTIALWCAHSYLLREEIFGVAFSPLLAFQSPLKRCGKSTSLKCVQMMAYDARMASSITSSSLFRVVDEMGVTLTIDESDNVLRDVKSDLLGIMNAGRDRMTARVIRTESIGDGKFKVREFNTFAPIALTSIRALKALTLSLADAKGKLAGLRKAKASAPDIKTAAKNAKTLNAHRKMAGQAALDLHRSSIRLVQIYGGGDKVYVVDIARTGQGALRLLNGLTVVAHNAQFELAHLEHAGVELDRIHCTLQAARLLLGERRMSLADAAADFLDVALDKVEQAGDWGAPNLTRSQLEYAASDAVAVFRLAQKMLPTLGRQMSAYEIQLSAVPAVARMELRGFRLDVAAHSRLVEDLECRVCEAETRTSMPAALARTSPTQTFRRRRAKRTPA